MGLSLQGLALSRQLYEQVQGLDQGRGGRMGTQALLLALECVNIVDGAPAKTPRENAAGTCPARGQ